MTTLTAPLSAARRRCSEYAGPRWPTDSALSPPGDYEGGLVKVTGPAIAEPAGPIGVALAERGETVAL